MMQIATSTSELKEISNNQIIINDENSFSMSDSSIKFEGNNNILFIDSNVHLENSSLSFSGDNSVIFLSANSHKYILKAALHHDSVLYVGNDVYFNNAPTIILSERTHAFIGRQCLFSTDIWLRTADPHLVYSMDTFELVNKSKSIYIGDHVWIGQHALLLKGTRIHSGSIIAAHCVLAGKTVPSNVSYAGNPGRQVAERIFWDEKCVHRWKKSTTKANNHFKGGDAFIYNGTLEHHVPFSQLEKSINSCQSSEKRLEVLLSLEQDKNRFAYMPNNSNKSGLKKIKHKFRLWLKRKLLRILK